MQNNVTHEDEIPVGKAQDLRGKKFNKWTVLYRVANPRTTEALWKCQCDCGNISVIRSSSLRNGASRQCMSCAAKGNQKHKKNIIGERFGKLTVIEEFEHKNNRIIWKCKCDCGNFINVSTSNLRTGNTQSCGCLHSEITHNNHFIDLTGQKFGKLTCLSYKIENKKTIWKCKCDCGNEIEVYSYNLKNGHTTSCGCINYSLGEEKISTLLNDNNIQFIIEKTFSTCKNPQTNYLLRFDFYVNNNYLIEYDGSQHFIQSFKEPLEQVQQRDIYKNQWCKENNIPLIRIPYTHLNNLCIEDLKLETTQFRVV